MRKQLGIIGSAQDLGYKQHVIDIAKKLGQEIAKTDFILNFGLEENCDSLSNIVAREAKKGGITTVGFCGLKGEKLYENNATVVVKTGSIIGGGRELPLVLSSDVIISLGGGSGTLTEMVIAYQANIPIITIRNTGGWSDRIQGYIDERKRIKVIKVRTPEQAIKTALIIKYKYVR